MRARSTSSLGRATPQSLGEASLRQRDRLQGHDQGRRGSSDEMITLIARAARSTTASRPRATRRVRLMKRGTSHPSTPTLIPNYADVVAGLKNQDYNSLNGQCLRRAAWPGPKRCSSGGPSGEAGSDELGGDLEQNTPYKGKISIYDDSIFIADAALYLKATQPDLGIDDPYQLNDKQFDAAVNLLKSLKPQRGRVVGRLRQADRVVREQGRRRRDDAGRTRRTSSRPTRSPCRRVKPKEGTTGWSDTWMI